MNHFTLLTVFTAVECGRLLDTAKLRGKKKKNALDAELLFRVAAGRVARACRAWGHDSLGDWLVSIDSLTRQGDYWIIESAKSSQVTFTWDAKNAAISVGQPYTLLDYAPTEEDEVAEAALTHKLGRASLV